MYIHTFISKASMRSTAYAAVIICFSTLYLVGCDTTFVDPFSNDSRFFTIYGYLDEANNLPGTGLNAVRVIPITRRAEVITSPADPQASIDARVFVIDLLTGQEIEWRHTLERLSDSNYGHVFKSNMRVAQNTTYRIEVRRSDGTVTFAETTIPAVSSIDVIQEPEPIIDPVSGSIRQGIILPGVTNVWSIDVSYFISENQCFFTNPIRVSYGSAGSATEEGWRFEANVSTDLRDLPTEATFAGNLDLCAIGLEVQVPDNDWLLPGTQIGDEVVQLAEIPSNVENGLGFFGSIGVIDNAWNTTNGLQAALRNQ